MVVYVRHERVIIARKHMSGFLPSKRNYCRILGGGGYILGGGQWGYILVGDGWWWWVFPWWWWVRVVGQFWLVVVGSWWVYFGWWWWVVVGIFWVLVGGDWLWWIVARFIITLQVFMNECTEKPKGFLQLLNIDIMFVGKTRHIQYFFSISFQKLTYAINLFKAIFPFQYLWVSDV